MRTVLIRTGDELCNIGMDWRYQFGELGIQHGVDVLLIRRGPMSGVQELREAFHDGVEEEQCGRRSMGHVHMHDRHCSAAVAKSAEV